MWLSCQSPIIHHVTLPALQLEMGVSTDIGRYGNTSDGPFSVYLCAGTRFDKRTVRELERRRVLRPGDPRLTVLSLGRLKH
jgi:hypothetical protein